MERLSVRSMPFIDIPEDFTFHLFFWVSVVEPPKLDEVWRFSFFCSVRKPYHGNTRLSIWISIASIIGCKVSGTLAVHSGRQLVRFTHDGRGVHSAQSQVGDEHQRWHQDQNPPNGRW